jgi:hypothetical protein
MYKVNLKSGVLRLWKSLTCLIPDKTAQFPKYADSQTIIKY